MKKHIGCYILIFILMLLILILIPKTGGYIWQPELINPLSALLFTVLTFLTAYIANTNSTKTGIFGTALFIMLFCPGSHTFFFRDEQAILELFSICIVPFFILQYNRISTLNFKYSYFIMLLMGIFCSYTHDSVTIPLCAAFLMLSYIQRRQLFKLACWPMVIGFVIGTTLSVIQSGYWNISDIGNWSILSNQTADGFIQLWETKIFILATLLTIYFLSSRKRRRRLWVVFLKHKLLTYCMLFSICAVPFAPLGLDNAISGVCFFSMMWSLILSHNIMVHIRKQKEY